MENGHIGPGGRNGRMAAIPQSINEEEVTGFGRRSSVSDAQMPAHDGASASRKDHAVFWMRPVGPTPTLPINAEPGASAKAIVSEIKACADRLIASGEASTIDLRFQKSMPEERAILGGLLGIGEVSAVVNSIGPACRAQHLSRRRQIERRKICGARDIADELR